MPRGTRYTTKDYLALAISLLLAFAVWFVHNLSGTYSDIVKCTFIVESDVPGHSTRASSPSDVVARCTLNGFDILANRFSSHRSVKTVNISSEHLHQRQGDVFYMTKDDLARYFRDIFTDDAHLEYFVTDTLNVVFPAVEHKKVPVRILSSLSLKPQYMSVGNLRVEPDSVIVYGRKEMLETVADVTTDLISARELSSDFYGETLLTVPPGVRLSVGKVRFLLPVVRYVEQDITVPVVPVNVPEGVFLQVFPENAHLRIKAVFPGVNEDGSLVVDVDFHEFENGTSGQCLGTVSGLPSNVLDYTLEPEVFNCIANNRY